MFTPRAPRHRAETARNAPVASVAIMQGSAEECLPVVQSLVDSGSAKPGQIVTVRAHQLMTITVDAGRVGLVPFDR